MLNQAIKGGNTYSFNDVVNQLLGLVHLLFGVCHDQTMEILLLVTGVGGVRTAFSFLHGSFATNGDFSLRFSLHLFQRVSTGADK